MAPVKLHIDGNGEIVRQPERAVVTTCVSKEDQDQKRAVEEVRKATQEIHARIKPLAIRNSDGTAREDTAIMRWASSSMSTSKFRATEHATEVRPSIFGGQEPAAAKKVVTTYRVTITVVTRFCDFEKLSEFTQQLALCPLASVSQVRWILTEETEKQLRAEVIKAAYDDSWEKAMALTRAMGLEKVRPVEVRNSGWGSGAMARSGGFGGQTGNPFGGQSGLFGNAAQPQAGGRGLGDGEELSYLPQDVICSTQVSVQFEAS